MYSEFQIKENEFAGQVYNLFRVDKKRAIALIETLSPTDQRRVWSRLQAMDQARLAKPRKAEEPRMAVARLKEAQRVFTEGCTLSPSTVCQIYKENSPFVKTR